MNSISKMYPNLCAADLSNLILKGKGVTSMSWRLEKDAGFCSGSSEHEDDHHSHHCHSPSDGSEDSVEVKFTPISKNKRKSSEPSRVVPDLEQVPLKKRYRFEQLQEDETQMNNSHFRPWAAACHSPSADVKLNPADMLIRHPGVTTLHRAILSTQIEQDQPLALIAKKPSTPINNSQKSIPTKAELAASHKSSTENLIQKIQLSCISQEQNEEKTECVVPLPQMSSTSSTMSPVKYLSPNKPSSQRNYKNMTRERRIEANARERTRVHTISAAYDTLRKAIPSYSNTQKLSKLSVLRVACSYILTLSRMTGEDFSADQSEPPVQDCIDSVTRTIQTEGKLRRKKDE